MLSCAWQLLMHHGIHSLQREGVQLTWAVPAGTVSLHVAGLQRPRSSPPRSMDLVGRCCRLHCNNPVRHSWQVGSCHGEVLT